MISVNPAAICILHQQYKSVPLMNASSQYLLKRNYIIPIFQVEYRGMKYLRMASVKVVLHLLSTS